MTKKPKAPRKIDYGPSKIKKSFVNAMTCCKNIKLSFETNSAFKKAYKFQWKNAHSTVLQNAWNQKNQHSHWKKQFHHQKPMLFIEKQSWITKNLEHHRKSITGPPKIQKFSKKNEMTCCKNVKPSLKSKSALKKAFKFNGKNVHSTVLQNACSQKDQHFHSKLIFNYFLIRIFN